jgi:hypothetical protein
MEILSYAVLNKFITRTKFMRQSSDVRTPVAGSGDRGRNVVSIFIVFRISLPDECVGGRSIYV